MARSLSFRHVEVIYAVVLTSSVTGAAARLCVSQPAVSNMIKDAEDRVGFALFTRQLGRIIPTPRAEALFAEIERSFTGLDAINNLCASLRDEQTRRIRVASTPAWATAVMPHVVRDYMRQYPHVRFEIRTRSSEYVQSVVSSCKADIGFALSFARIPGVSKKELVSPRLKCLMHIDHPLATRDVIHASDLVNERMVTFSHIEGTDTLIEAAFANYGGMPPSVVECPTAIVVNAMVGVGIGVALVHSISEVLFRDAPVVSIPFLPAIHVTQCAYWATTSAPDFDRDFMVELALEHSQAIVHAERDMLAR